MSIIIRFLFRISGEIFMCVIYFGFCYNLVMLDKNEARREYKNTLQPMGVYCLTNSKNGKMFIGSSMNVNNIFNRISFQLKLGSYTNEDVQKDYNLLGEAAFSFKVLDYLKPVDELGYDYKADLQVLEELWLEKLQPYGKSGYNTKNK